MKRKYTDVVLGDQTNETTTPKKRRTSPQADTAHQINGNAEDSTVTDATPTGTPSTRGGGRTPSSRTKAKAQLNGGLDVNGENTPTRKGKGKLLFSTPTKSTKAVKGLNGTPSTTKNADRSAKRKSARTLLESNAEDDVDDWDGGDALAQQIWDGEEEAGGEDDDADPLALSEDGEVIVEAGASLPETPSKRGRGRPKGSKTKRSPTPEGDIPPHERYFFQNRSGSVKTSNHTISSLTFLTHDEYFERIRKYKDPHDPEKAFLLDLHARSFPQWQFELSEQFNICLFGWGSKRKLVHQFAEYLHPKIKPPPRIVIVNGYTPNVTIRSIFTTIATAIFGPEGAPTKLGAQPVEVLDFILSHLNSNPPPQPLVLMINSIDATPLRRSSTQTLLARLAANPHINLLATADTPTFLLLWDSSLREQFNFVFHDCTNFAPYDAEISVVDDVHELLGRKGRRVGGKEGVAFVLKSLPENARNLYRVLLAEVLAGLDAGTGGGRGTDEEEEDEGGGAAARQAGSEEAGVEYRVLYQKAVEEFICTSEMAFRTLLKEFHDHQMLVSRKDAGGTEVLGVPLAREDMEGVLEELVAG